MVVVYFPALNLLNIRIVEELLKSFDYFNNS